MKITPTLAGAMSGSIGGATASHNRGGAYFRRRSVPVNPNTIRQQTVRAAVASLVAAWNDDLTQPERDAWTTYAQNVPVTDRVGSTITNTGQNWFVATNTPRAQAVASGLTNGAGMARIDAAPTTFNRGEPIVSMTGANIIAGVWDVDANLSVPTSDDGDVMLYVGLAQNAARKFYKGPWQLAAIAPIAAAATTVNFAPDQADPLDWASERTFVDDQHVPMRVIIAYDDGRVSSPFEAIITPVTVG